MANNSIARRSSRLLRKPCPGPCSLTLPVIASCTATVSDASTCHPPTTSSSSSHWSEVTLKTVPCPPLTVSLSKMGADASPYQSGRRGGCTYLTSTRNSG